MAPFFLALGPIMVAGSFLGKHALDRLPEKAFVMIIEVVLLVSGITLLVGG